MYPGSNESTILEPDTEKTDGAVDDLSIQIQEAGVKKQKENSQTPSRSMRSSEADSPSVPGARQTRKRTQMLENTERMRQAEESEKAKSIQQEFTSKLRGADTGKRGPVQKANINAPKVTTTPKTTPQKRSPPQPFDGELRRSSRKRRKASNYAKPIDVGAETSDYQST